MNFDVMSKLYREDPEEFHRQFRQAIDQVIEQAPEHRQQRLRGLQFTIDSTLRHYKNPVARMYRFQQMFWEGVLNFVKVTKDPLAFKKEQEQTSAKILSLNSHR